MTAVWIIVAVLFVAWLGPAIVDAALAGMDGAREIPWWLALIMGLARPFISLGRWLGRAWRATNDWLDSVL